MAAPFVLREAFIDTQIHLKNNPELIRRTPVMQSASRLFLDDFSAVGPETKSKVPVIHVQENTSFRCAQALVSPGKRTAVLNFANAYVPGGGVKEGAPAQEECLCRTSNLYEALTLPYFLRHYYKWNQKNTGDMGSDRIIFSPGVTVFKTDDDIPTMMPPEEWFQTDVITCAAPYYNSEKKHPVNMEHLKSVFRNRIRNILETAMACGADRLVLGAFGCGAFNNPPDLVAGVFRELLLDSGYFRFFEKIVFAIKPSGADCPNLRAFRNAFPEENE
ncbi:MAG: TIGR02452 family protein [Clostridia bacterium]|nr:TIGR02452 family protein [Clostridia bacterium]